jgi:hypothetical protein
LTACSSISQAGSGIQRGWCNSNPISIHFGISAFAIRLTSICQHSLFGASALASKLNRGLNRGSVQQRVKRICKKNAEKTSKKIAENELHRNIFAVTLVTISRSFTSIGATE